MTMLHIWCPQEIEHYVRGELLRIEDKVDTFEINYSSLY